MLTATFKKIQEMWVDKSNDNAVYKLFPKTLAELVLIGDPETAGTENEVTLADIIPSTGIIDIAHGGTGQSTATAGFNALSTGYLSLANNAITPANENITLGSSSVPFAHAYITEVTGNAATATTLATARTINVTGSDDSITATAASFDGSANVEINITGIDASLINSGKIDIERLPEAALPKLVKVENLSAFQALTKASVQNGDTVKVIAAIDDSTFGKYSAGQLFYIVDDTKLAASSETPATVANLKLACEPYTAVVDWNSILNKPGIVYTEGDQTVAGTKTFSDGIILSTPKKFEGVEFNGQNDVVNYAACDTASATATKAVTCAGFTLTAGARIVVKFANANTASAVMLQVNSLEAKAINYNGAAIASNAITAGKLLELVYDGTAFEVVGGLDISSTFITVGTDEEPTDPNTDFYYRFLD